MASERARVAKDKVSGGEYRGLLLTLQDLCCAAMGGRRRDLGRVVESLGLRLARLGDPGCGLGQIRRKSVAATSLEQREMGLTRVSRFLHSIRDDETWDSLFFKDGPTFRQLPVGGFARRALLEVRISMVPPEDASLMVVSDPEHIRAIVQLRRGM